MPKLPLKPRMPIQINSHHQSFIHYIYWELKQRAITNDCQGILLFHFHHHLLFLFFSSFILLYALDRFRLICNSSHDWWSAVGWLVVCIHSLLLLSYDCMRFRCELIWRLSGGPIERGSPLLMEINMYGLVRRIHYIHYSFFYYFKLFDAYCYVSPELTADWGAE